MGGRAFSFKASNSDAGDLNCQQRYARNISRLDSTRSIRGRMPNSLEMASESSSI